MFQMAGIGPMQGQANVFFRYFEDKIPKVIASWSWVRAQRGPASRSTTCRTCRRDIEVPFTLDVDEKTRAQTARTILQHEEKGTAPRGTVPFLCRPGARRRRRESRGSEEGGLPPTSSSAPSRCRSRTGKREAFAPVRMLHPLRGFDKSDVGLSRGA